MRREFKVEANVGAPQVAYREALTKKAEIDYTHKKQSGGSGQFARVKLRFEPLEAGSGVQFENEVVGGNVPKEYVPAVEKGIRQIAASGVLAGFPVIDFQASSEEHTSELQSLMRISYDVLCLKKKQT